LALIAAGFSIVWGVKAYQSKKHHETGGYALAALFLVSSAVYYFHAYMTLIAFFTVVFGGMLLFIYVVSEWRFPSTLSTSNSLKQENGMPMWFMEIN
jgi:hypothetical protein